MQFLYVESFDGIETLFLIHNFSRRHSCLLPVSFAKPFSIEIRGFIRYKVALKYSQKYPEEKAVLSYKRRGSWSRMPDVRLERHQFTEPGMAYLCN